MPRAALTRLLLLILLGGIFPVTSRGHVPVPDSVLDPHTAPEAWNVLGLARANVERLLRENRLAEVNDQLSLCGPALRTLPRVAPSDRQTLVADRSVQTSVAVGSLAQAVVAGDRPTAATAFASLRAALDHLSALFDPATVHAEIFVCPMHPDCLSPDRAALCPRCGMALVPRRIPYSFVYVPAGEPSLLLTASPDRPLAVGEPAQVTVHLRNRDGSPVRVSDLMVTHTQPIHLLIVDPALADYHHEHPVPTPTPGDYAFTFTPTRDTSYRIFADVVPQATGLQEYPCTDVPGAGVSPTFQAGPDSLAATAAGLDFRLSVEDQERQPLRAQQARTLRVTVQDAARAPVTQLEPVMAAFAHLVGFYDDGRTVVHLHPAGGEITNPALRGGPELDFKFFPPRAGHLRLFVQVQVAGRPVFAPFDLNVQP